MRGNKNSPAQLGLDAATAASTATTAEDKWQALLMHYKAKNHNKYDDE